MHVSVIICTHTSDRFGDLVEAARSVQSGTHEDYELVLVSDGSEAVSDLMHEEFTDLIDAGTCTVELLRANSGLLAARNRGAAAATGDVVAFLDDDAIAEKDWLARLVDPYDTEGRRAVGGRVTPAWVAPGGKPEFLPEEFYWLIGATHRGFGPGGGFDSVSTEGEVRNTNGSNLSFEAAAFSELGGFDTDIVGRKGGNHLQGGETELCARFGAEFDEGVWYVPDAKVSHKVFAYRTSVGWLLRRAFWQGYSKRALGRIAPSSGGEEWTFLTAIFGQFLPHRVRQLFETPSRNGIKRLGFLVLATIVVGIGYMYGITKWR